MTSSDNWRRRLEQWPLPVPTFDLDRAHTALLVIDMQRFCADPGYGLGKTLRERFPDLARDYERRVGVVIGNVQRLLTHFRDRDGRVIFTTFGPELPDGSDLPWYRRRTDGNRRYNNFPRGTPEHGILPQVEPRTGELVINKTTTSPFTSTGIARTLHHLGVTGLVIAGVSTEVCVEGTARDAADFGFRCVVVDDACTTLYDADHQASLAAFARLFGRVTSTRELLQELGGATTARET
jgi:nicotinamidase-related amidase